MQSPMIEIAAVWQNQSKNGETYFSGYFGRSRLLIFKNKSKQADNHPDWRIYITEDQKRDNGATAEQPQRVQLNQPQQTQSEVPF